MLFAVIFNSSPRWGAPLYYKKEEQKASGPMLVTASGIVMLIMPKHPLKALSPMLVTPAGDYTVYASNNKSVACCFYNGITTIAAVEDCVNFRFFTALYNLLIFYKQARKYQARLNISQLRVQ